MDHIYVKTKIVNIQNHNWLDVYFVKQNYINEKKLYQQYRNFITSFCKMTNDEVKSFKEMKYSEKKFLNYILKITRMTDFLLSYYQNEHDLFKCHITLAEMYQLMNDIYQIKKKILNNLLPNDVSKIVISYLIDSSSITEFVRKIETKNIYKTPLLTVHYPVETVRYQIFVNNIGKPIYSEYQQRGNSIISASMKKYTSYAEVFFLNNLELISRDEIKIIDEIIDEIKDYFEDKNNNDILFYQNRKCRGLMKKSYEYPVFIEYDGVHTMGELGEIIVGL